MYQRKVFDRFLTRGEERQLMRHVAQFNDLFARRDHAMLQLLRQTGMRVGSLVGLDVWEAREALRTGRLVLADESAKRGLGYSVPVNRFAKEALRTLIKVRQRLGFDDLDDDALILSRHGKRISIRSVEARMQKWRESAGLGVEASPHWLRHTLAKRMLETSEAAQPLRIVQHALGHSTERATQVYTFPDREEIAQAFEAAAR